MTVSGEMTVFVTAEKWTLTSDMQGFVKRYDDLFHSDSRDPNIFAKVF